MKNALLLAALSASLLAGTAATAPAYAETRGARFWVINAEDPTPANIQMGNAVEKALAADPTGMSLMDVSKCLKPGDRSCASAHDLLVRIQYYDRDASVHGVPLTTVSQLPEFYRTEVVMETAPEGVYQMDCERKAIGSPSGYEPFGNCVQRGFYLKKGELAYVDKTTRKVIGAEHCANPVGRRVGKPPCAYIHHDADAADGVFHIEQVGAVNVLEDECTGLLRPGETEYESPAVERCPDSHCSFYQANQYLGEEQQWVGSYPAQDGEYIVRVPLICAQDNAACRIVFCKDLANGRRSWAVSAQTIDFKVERKTHHLVARILHDEQTVEAANAKDVNGNPSTLYWHFGTWHPGVE